MVAVPSGGVDGAFPADTSTDVGTGTDPDVDVDIVIVGAGILGLYQLWRAREDGFSVQTLEAAEGVGGVWFWNRYPGALLDSESYTYGFLFSKELFQEWDWSARFAGQPELERYLNHAVDKLDLRRHIRFGSRVQAAEWDEESGTWTVHTGDGYSVRARYLISTTGVLSVPNFPNIPGREDFRGEAHHTGLWPDRPVEVAGKRVAVVGTGSSGVQVIPMIADQVESLTVYQRSPNWVTPLNNGPITAEEQAELNAGFEEMVATIQASVAGFLHVPYDRPSTDFTKPERWAFYEKVWAAPGFATLSSNYTDMFTNKEANADFCEFITEEIRSIVKDPETAEKLIPKDHLYAGKRPPFGTDYYQAYNKPNVSLIDTRAEPIVRVTETGIETTEGLREFDLIVWATGYDFGTGALLRMGIRGRDGLALTDYWADGPATYLGIMSHQFPNLFYPGGPHGAAGNNPRYGGDQSDFVADLLLYARSHGYRTVEVPAELEKGWNDMVGQYAAHSPFGEHSYFYGANIPGKPRRFLLNPAGRPKMLEMMAEAVDSDYQGFCS